MAFVKISADFGIVVRKASLIERNVTKREVLLAFEVDTPLGETDDLYSFGPHFGPEASDELCKRLEALGLRYVDDYFVFAPEAPDWCSFGATCQK